MVYKNIYIYTYIHTLYMYILYNIFTRNSNLSSRNCFEIGWWDEKTFAVVHGGIQVLVRVVIRYMVAPTRLSKSIEASLCWDLSPATWIVAVATPTPSLSETRCRVLLNFAEETWKSYMRKLWLYWTQLKWTDVGGSWTESERPQLKWYYPWKLW